MKPEQVRKIADAVLYEGYMLYPYRPSSVKNRQRWTFGGLYPEAYASRSGDPSTMHTELLVEGDADTTVTIEVRFLHLLSRDDGRNVWQEGMEREVVVGDSKGEQRFCFPAWSRTEEGVRRSQEQIDGVVMLSSEQVGDGLRKLSIDVSNVTRFQGSEDVTRDEASLQALVATHAIARVSQGSFVSLTDPPEQYREAASQCRNVGAWPVLVGDPGCLEWMLASPIILYDYPEVAPESPGDLFDGAEIDEILTLRIMTMTDAEKAEMRGVDERTSRILDRTESLTPEELMKLHGVLRRPHGMGGGA